jgi:beta-lactamase class A
MSTLSRTHLLFCGIIVVAAFALGFLASSLTGKEAEHAQADSLAIREYDERYEYIRPLLICQINEQTENQEFKSLEGEIETIVREVTEAQTISTGSVYFRDLNSGRWMGVNELEPHSPASLLKMPVMMAYFKQSEENPQALETRHTYVRKADDINPLITERLLKPNTSYRVEDLIRGMIVQSDNSAKDLLTSKVDQSILKETYNVLGIADPYSNNVEAYEISAKTYALFFRVLYNGTFLNRDMSNRAAQLLSEVQFDKGLRAGTPTNIKIAHKYGVRATPQADKTMKVELSDCGIIYDRSPYLLCIMVEGKDPYVLADVIKTIAETVYRSASAPSLE